MIESVMKFLIAQNLPFEAAKPMMDIVVDDPEHWERRSMWSLYDTTMEK